MNWTSQSRRLARKVLDWLPVAARSRLQSAHYAGLLRRMNLEAEPDLIIAKALVSAGSTVVDVGANIGVYTRWLSEFVGGGGRVIALEPVPETCATLERIASRFGWRNVSLVAAAASDQPGVVWMRIPEDDRGIPSHYLARVADRGEDARSVRAVALDEILASVPVTFVKIDVEGHELPCLRGGLQTIRRCHPALLVEINRDAWGLPSVGAKVVGLLRAEGYSVWTFHGGQLAQWNGGVDSVNYWFLQPSHVAGLGENHPTLMSVDLGRSGG